MKTRTQFASEPEQHELIENLKTATKKYVSQLYKEGIQTILLNGSIKRGDFCTQHLGGYVDLVVMVKDEKIFNWKKTFGEAEEEFYIYHCVRKEIDGLKVGFQIEKRPFETLDYFETLDENRRWAHLESEILYDEDDLFGVIVNCCGLKKSVFFIRQPSFVHRPQKLYFWRQVQVV